ncbi:unnamed protein product [Vicia faba]|uniref:Acid phosphatase n=1 Tax=Vicia faba TaxID=3906 RepID=A0AAV0ZHS9_VICFA|nr:unnamed protein product [Vicia faba]
MSAYAHQMEQQHSGVSLSDNSDTSSHYGLDSGFYMSSFTATIFVVSLVTLGVLLITLLVSLVIMLQSCQSKSTGVIELVNMNDYYSYCRVYSLHAEINRLERYDLPNICRDLTIHYIKGGHYAKELNLIVSMIDDYFKNLRPSDNGLDVVLLDIDDIVPPNSYQRFHRDGISNCVKEAKHVNLMFVLRLYMNLQTDGWPIILVSREPEMYQNVTINHLVSAGFRGWSSLMMRTEDSESTKGNEYFSRQRSVIQKKGFHIKSIVSSHLDVLAAPDTRILNFLLPGLVCTKFEHHIESIDTGN